MTERHFKALEEIEYSINHHEEMVSTINQPEVGWFCTYTPLEILHAVGLYPSRVLPEPGRTMMRADAYIDRNFCPYVRTCLGEALDGASHRFTGGMVMANSCDSMRRLYDVWRYNIGGDFVYLLDLPRVNNEAAVTYYRECLQNFIKALGSYFRVSISDAALADAITRQNRVRSLLKEFYRTNQNRNMPLTAGQVHNVLKAGISLPLEMFTGQLERLLGEINDTEAEMNEGPRLLITGSVLENPRIIELIEQYGARVVADDLCTGTRQFWEPVEFNGDPLTALSRHYLGKIPCPRMRDTQKRFDHIFRLIDEFRVDGIIFYTLKFCAPFLCDIPVLKEQIEDRGIPNLVLEGDYTPGTLGRVRTRIEAFIEMLNQNVRTY